MNYTCRRGQHHTIAVRVKMLIWGMVLFFFKKIRNVFILCWTESSMVCDGARTERDWA